MRISHGQGWLLLALIGSTQSRWPVPVLFDTDIGTFADDTLALAMALTAPELDVRMLLTTSGDAVFRARVAAKQLRLSGRADIPIGIGVSLPNSFPAGANAEPLEVFASKEDLEAHPGGVFADGPAAAAAMILDSGRSDWIIIVLGPSSSTAALLEREPRVAAMARVTVMGASVCGGVTLPWGAITPRASTNERQDVRAARVVGGAAWRKAPEYAPVVASMQVEFTAERWARVLAASEARATEAISPTAGMMRVYHAWWAASVADASVITHQEAMAIETPLARSVLCFDCLAVALAYAGGPDGGQAPVGARLWKGSMNFTKDGFTQQRLEQPNAASNQGGCLSVSCHVQLAVCNLSQTTATIAAMWPMRMSVGWEDLDLFLDDVVDRLQRHSGDGHGDQAAYARMSLALAALVCLVGALSWWVRQRQQTGLHSHVHLEEDSGVQMGHVTRRDCAGRSEPEEGAVERSVWGVEHVSGCTGRRVTQEEDIYRPNEGEGGLIPKNSAGTGHCNAQENEKEQMS